MEDDTKTIAMDVKDVAARSPRTHVDSQPLPTDSMVTVPLSETGTDGGLAADDDDAPATPLRPEITIDERRLSSRPTSAEILQAIREPSRSSTASVDTPAMVSPTISLPEDEENEIPPTPTSEQRTRSDTSGSDQSAHVDWAALEKKEEQQEQGDGQDEV
jgi:hypothetical protein